MVLSLKKKEKPIGNGHKKMGTVSHKEQLAEIKEQQKRYKKKKEEKSPMTNETSVIESGRVGPQGS